MYSKLKSDVESGAFNAKPVDSFTWLQVVEKAGYQPPNGLMIDELGFDGFKEIQDAFLALENVRKEAEDHNKNLDLKFKDAVMEAFSTENGVQMTESLWDLVALPGSTHEATVKRLESLTQSLTVFAKRMATMTPADIVD